ncbi:MAG: hypothetical protein KDC35_13530 [Acidobacteria bacterium]|nr:hypothetical protein [Acidobacteriota bacterium]
MIQSKTQFQSDLFDEHFEECGFLMEQIQFIRSEPWDTYADGLELEVRFHRHMNALLKGGSLARDRCLLGLESESWGEVATAIIVAETAPDFRDRLEQLTPDEHVLTGLFHGWLHRPPCEGWSQRWQFLERENPSLLPALAKAGAWLRLPEIAQLVRHLPPQGLFGIQALSRYKSMGSAPSDWTAETLACALRSGNADLEVVRAHHAQEPSLLLACAGTDRDVTAYVDLLNHPEMVELGVWGLALLGIPSTFEALTPHLIANGDCVAEAMKFLTGIDSPDDSKTWEGVWRAHLDHNVTHWSDMARVRHGQAWSASDLANDLFCVTRPNALQYWLLLEYVLRTGNDVPLEWEFWSHQRDSLNWTPSEQAIQVPFPFRGR